MIDLLLQVGISNLCISLALAAVAWAVHATGKRPFVAHLLWLLVLVKLVTPPVMTVPLIAIPGPDAVTAQAFDNQADQALVALASGTSHFSKLKDDALYSGTAGPITVEQGKFALVLIWLLGSAGILCWSLVRIWRFNRLLHMASKAAPPRIQKIAARIAQRMGLTSTPTIFTTSAHLSPLVWWFGGKVRILLPDSIANRIEAEQLQWLLAHELAHVRRRDHLVRWLEWMACIGFWWNPVVWVARRHLRANEEICCDAMVLSSLEPAPRTYANSLMSVVEYLASPVLRPPAMASEINSGGSLERRFRMIVSGNPNPRTSRWLLGCILLCSALILPLGLAHGQDFEKINKRLQKAVKEGEITQKHADIMMTALRKATLPDNGEKHITLEDYMAIDAKLKKAVAEGKMSKEDAEAKLIAMRKRIAPEPAKREREAGIRIRIGEVLDKFDKDKDGSVTKKEAGESWPHLAPADADGDGKVTAREMHAAWSEDDDRGEGREREPSLEDHFKKMGISSEEFGNMAKTLHEHGKIPREKLEGVLGGALRVIHEIKSEGEEFELSPRLQIYFKDELGLTDELVVRYSRRLAHKR